MQVNREMDPKDDASVELTSAERRLVASVRHLKQRREERLQEKLLQEGSEFFALFALL
jgi:hypothetical protein